MKHDWWQDMLAWWATVPSEFVLLFALPFVVAAAGLLADWCRRCRYG